MGKSPFMMADPLKEGYKNGKRFVRRGLANLGRKSDTREEKRER